MSNTPETLAAIRGSLEAVLAKLLECAPTAEQEWPELVERARAALERKPEENYGNAAAMREAVEKAYNNIKKAREFIAWQTREDELLMEAQQEIKTALSEPARNCDRFATAEEARKAFEAAHSRGIVHNIYTAAFDWLFAEAKGDAE